MKVLSKMKLEIKKEQNKTQSGQVLLFVVIAMSIALTIGVAISSRTLSSLSRTSRTDTASRVYAAAEGGIETYMNKPYEVLGEYAEAYDDGSLADYCPDEYIAAAEGGLAGCAVTYDITGENVTSRAVVTVKNYKTNKHIGSDNFYTFDLKNGDTKEIVLGNYNRSIDICWNDAGSSANLKPDLYLFKYSANGVVSKEIVVPNSGQTNSTYYTNANSVSITPTLSSASTVGGFQYCLRNYGISPVVRGLRIRALFEDAEIGVRVPVDYESDFPVQGYEIISRGEIIQEGVTKSVKTIRVYKSLPYLPGVFENAIYSEGFIVD